MLLNELKPNQIADEYDSQTNQWVARYVIIGLEPHTVSAICLYDSLSRESPGQLEEISKSCILSSRTFYWKIDGARL